jgi:hypothetical protein
MPNVIRKRPKIGDIVEVATPAGLAYVQYTHKYDKPPHWGALIRVLSGLHAVRPESFSEIAAQPASFCVFFPLGAAVHRGIVQIVANEAIPEEAQQFPLFRAAGVIDREGRVLDWWLWDGERSWRVGELTSEQRNLPIKEIWNDTLLIKRIAEGWKPSDRV